MASTSRSASSRTILDCPNGQGGTAAVSGATVTVAGAERVVYFNDQGQLDLNATATGMDNEVVVFNAPAGPQDITVTAGPYTYRM